MSILSHALDVLKTCAEGIKIGIFKTMSDVDYFAHTALNCSGLKVIAQKTPLHFKHQQTAERKETPALKLGSAIHCATLEPEAFDDRYVVVPEGVGKQSKADKAIWADLQADGKIALSYDEGEQVANVANAVRTHKTASKLLQYGDAEVAVFAEMDGLNVKCKCDYLRENVAIIDLKTTEDASEKGFMQSVLKYGYHQQAAFYLDVMEAIGQPVESFIFIVVEKTAPYAIGIYELDETYIEIGRELNRKAMNTYRECLETGNWYGYSTNIELLSPPSWAIKQAEYI